MKFFQTVPSSSKVFVFPSLFHVSRLTRCVVGVLFARHKIVVRQPPLPPPKQKSPPFRNIDLSVNCVWHVAFWL